MKALWTDSNLSDKELGITASYKPLEYSVAMDAQFNSALCCHYIMLYIVKAYFKKCTVELRHRLCNHRLFYKDHGLICGDINRHFHVYFSQVCIQREMFKYFLHF